MQRHVPGPLILIWDRARPHRSQITRTYLAAHPEIMVEELPAYAPELNPEEYCHGNVKQHLKNARPSTKAEIRARAIIVGGKVEGNLFASEKVELQAKCELLGDITSKSLLVEHGAMFHGSSKMKDGIPAGHAAASVAATPTSAPKQDQPRPAH